MFTELFFSHNFNTNKVNFHASLMPIHCFLFEIQIIKNGFTGPMSYRVFGETGPGFLLPDSIFQVDPSPGCQASDNFESDFDHFLQRVRREQR